MKHVQGLSILAASLFCLTSCGPSYSPVGAPSKVCQIITETGFKAAKKDGAASARARISKNGIVSMNIGMGINHCSSSKGANPICRRPNDFVIHYTLSDGRDTYVIVPKDTEYRLTINRKPIPCEVMIK